VSERTRTITIVSAGRDSNRWLPEHKLEASPIEVVCSGFRTVLYQSERKQNLSLENSRIRCRNSSVDIVTRPRIIRPRNRVSIPGRGKRFFLFSEVHRSSLGSTQDLMLWVPGALSPNRKAAEASNSPLAIISCRLRMSGVMPPPYAFMGCSRTSYTRKDM